MNSSSIHNYSSSFARGFPAPEYLTMPAVGIDVSDYAIKYVLLKRKKGRVELCAYGKVDLPLEVVERGEIKDQQTVVKLLSRIREDNNFEFAHLALPEEHAYLFQTNIPKGNGQEINQMLEFHLKENVPIDANEAVFDYTIFKEREDDYDVNVSVYPMNISAQYVSALEESGFKVLSIEVEGQATARALISKRDTASVLIIDIGRNSASLSISTGGSVTFSAKLDTGGDFFTRAIARELDVSFQEAEKLKIKHGFRDTPEDKMVFEGLLPVMSKFAEAIHKHLMYWHMHVNTKEFSAEDISKVIIVGGNANIVGLAEYLEATLDVSVEVGDVWKNIFSYENYVPKIHAKSSLEYATAIGLAIRSLLRSN